MGKRIVINPVTRISGFMEIDVMVENNQVMDAKTKGLLFRGFEKMLVGRNPFDAVYFTQRICGICSTAHSMASSLALEGCLGLEPTEQGRYLRDILHGCEFLQNHLRHFYQYTIPDYVPIPEIQPLYPVEHGDFRMPGKENQRIANNYFTSLDMSRSAHEMLALLGGKAPHNHGVFIGGITTQATVNKIVTMKSMLKRISGFIEDHMMPDAYTLAAYYKDYFKMGKGYGNLLSYGCFDQYKALGTLYVNPTVKVEGKYLPFDPGGITEEIDYSWYTGAKDTYTPYEEIPEADMQKIKGYSWVKAPRYQGVPFEVGPLARQWLSGAYRGDISTMDRVIARVLEAKKIADIIKVLLDQVVPGVPLQEEYTLPDKAEGAGLIDTTRGALGHWVRVENQKISFYQIITPSAWNFSTRDNNNQAGTAEEALIGTRIKKQQDPVELGRIVRSFDPCVSCATHVYIPGHPVQTIEVMP